MTNYLTTKGTISIDLSLSIFYSNCSTSSSCCFIIPVRLTTHLQKICQVLLLYSAHIFVSPFSFLIISLALFINTFSDFATFSSFWQNNWHSYKYLNGYQSTMFLLILWIAVKVTIFQLLFLSLSRYIAVNR